MFEKSMSSAKVCVPVPNHNSENHHYLNRNEVSLLKQMKSASPASMMKRQSADVNGNVAQGFHFGMTVPNDSTIAQQKFAFIKNTLLVQVFHNDYRKSNEKDSYNQSGRNGSSSSQCPTCDPFDLNCCQQPLLSQSSTSTANLWSCNGRQMFQAFIDVNVKQNDWFPELTEALKSLRFQGYVCPAVLLIHGSSEDIDTVLDAWCRRIIIPPEHHTIQQVALSQGCLVLPKVQNDVMALPDIICRILARLKSQNQVANMNRLCDEIKSDGKLPKVDPSYHELIQQSVHTVLGQLIKQRKVYYTGKGYFLASNTNRKINGGSIYGTVSKNSTPSKASQSIIYSNCQEVRKCMTNNSTIYSNSTQQAAPLVDVGSPVNDYTIYTPNVKTLRQSVVSYVNNDDRRSNSLESDDLCGGVGTLTASDESNSSVRSDCTTTNFSKNPLGSVLERSQSLRISKTKFKREIFEKVKREKSSKTGGSFRLKSAKRLDEIFNINSSLESNNSKEKINTNGDIGRRFERKNSFLSKIFNRKRISKSQREETVAKPTVATFSGQFPPPELVDFRESLYAKVQKSPEKQQHQIRTSIPDQMNTSPIRMTPSEKVYESVTRSAGHDVAAWTKKATDSQIYASPRMGNGNSSAARVLYSNGTPPSHNTSSTMSPRTYSPRMAHGNSNQRQHMSDVSLKLYESPVQIQNHVNRRQINKADNLYGHLSPSTIPVNHLPEQQGRHDVPSPMMQIPEDMSVVVDQRHPPPTTVGIPKGYNVLLKNRGGDVARRNVNSPMQPQLDSRMTDNPIKNHSTPPNFIPESDQQQYTRNFIPNSTQSQSHAKNQQFYKYTPVMSLIRKSSGQQNTSPSNVGGQFNAHQKVDTIHNHRNSLFSKEEVIYEVDSIAENEDEFIGNSNNSTAALDNEKNEAPNASVTPSNVKTSNEIRRVNDDFIKGERSNEKLRYQSYPSLNNLMENVRDENRQLNGNFKSLTAKRMMAGISVNSIDTLDDVNEAAEARSGKVTATVTDSKDDVASSAFLKLDESTETIDFGII